MADWVLVEGNKGMSEQASTSGWKQPQNYIIALLVLGIAGYIGYQQLQPKTNKLAQASAYFDAIDAEERAEAEKERAAEEKEKARLAAIEMEKAKEEARIAQQKAKQAEQQAQVAKAQQQSVQRQAQQQQQAAYNANASNWMVQSIRYCVGSPYVTCDLTCVNGNGSTRTVSATVYYVNSWYMGNEANGSYRTTNEYYQAVCRSL